MNSRMRVLQTIALSTFRQGLRGRMFFLVLTATVSIFMLGTVFRGFAGKANLELRLILETGLALSAFVILGTAIILSCRGLGEGSDGASYQTLFSLPIDRDGVHWGHLAGIAMTLCAYTVAMAVAMSIVLYWRFSVWRWSLIVHFGTIFVEGVMLAAIASLVALGKSTVVTFFATLAIAIIAHTEGVVLHLARESHDVMLEGAAWVVVRLLPCFASLDIKAVAVRDLYIPWGRLSWALLHCVLYLGILLVLASLVRRRLGE